MISALEAKIQTAGSYEKNLATYEECLEALITQAIARGEFKTSQTLPSGFEFPVTKYEDLGFNIIFEETGKVGHVFMIVSWE